jgi:CRP/FNR family transcriptional regulator, anaerobic regulatory protein
MVISDGFCSSLTHITITLVNEYCNMIEQLKANIQLAGKFSDEDVALFAGYMTEDTIEKNEHFLQIGQISRHLAFIGSGLVMHYKMHDGMEIPIEFSPEGHWIAYLASFSNGTPSDVAIKALEETRLLKLSAKNLQELFEAHPKFMALKNFYTEISFMSIAQHGADLAMLTGAERYYKFQQEKPELINRVPQYYIAAYLGIKPQSLSRIRKEA